MEKLKETEESFKDIKSQITCLKSEISQITHSEESEHSQLIKEGLLLLREFRPDKAKELEETLSQIKSQITHLKSEISQITHSIATVYKGPFLKRI
jgi:prefoldin subunit 5